MYDPNTENNNAAPGMNGRADGGYHYAGSYGNPMYSDAHYVPAGENTVPPRYYTPPQRSYAPPAPRKRGGRVLGVICICLVCALLGGLGGAAIVQKAIDEKMAVLEESVSQMTEKQSVLSTSTGSPVTPAATEGGLAPAEIYALACEQVVGISTEVTYVNFFGQSSSSAVEGSGFIVTEDGYIITNFHVIEYAYQYGYKVTVMLHDGTRYEATIVGAEADNDIAVLKIDAAGLKSATLGDSNRLQVGDAVYAVGNPLGELEFTMTSGHVSALDRLITTQESNTAINMFQIDAAVNSGNSGGPVYNAAGEVVGIVTAKYSSSGVEGIGFAIPAADAEPIAEDLITRGYVTGKAYMGVTFDDRYDSTYSRFYNLPDGAFVYFVEKDSAAEKAGLQAGDIVTAIDDRSISSRSDVVSALRQYSAGDSAVITVYRANETLQLNIVFDEVKPDSDIGG